MRKSYAFFAGVFFGTLAGYLIGILSAPRSGEETRQDLSDKAIELRERAGETAGRLRQEISLGRQNVAETVMSAGEAAAEVAEEVEEAAHKAASAAKEATS